jgi:hypothetical protein
LGKKDYLDNDGEDMEDREYMEEDADYYSF